MTARVEAIKLITELQATIRRYPPGIATGALAWVVADVMVGQVDTDVASHRDALALFLTQIVDLMGADGIDLEDDPYLAPAVRWGVHVRQRLGGETT